MRVPRILVWGVTLGAAPIVVPSTSHGQAFLEWEVSPRAAAIAGAATTIVDDPSAVFYNPAAITHLGGTVVQAGAIINTEDGRFRAFGDAVFDREPGPIVGGAVYVTHQIARDWTGGLAINAPWSINIDWEDGREFIGRFRSVDTNLRTLSFRPVLAYGSDRAWSVAVGLDVAAIQFDLDRFEQDPALSALIGEGPVALARSNLDSEGTSVGWNASALYHPRDDLILGAHVRSESEVDLNGRVEFIDVAPEDLRAFPAGDSTIGDVLDARFRNGTTRIPFTFPAIVTGGAAYRPVPEVWVRGDLQWVNWSAFDAIELQFQDAERNEAIALGYDDTWALRVGAEVEYLPGRIVRLGYAYEGAPAEFATVNPVLPTASSNSYTIGFGFRSLDFGFDVSYGVSILEDQEGVAFPANEISADGVYEAVEHRFGAAFTRQL